MHHRTEGTASLCTEEFFLRSQYMHMALSSYQQGGVGGQDLDGQCDTYRWSWLSFCSQPNLHTAEQGLRNPNKTYTIIL